MILMVNYFDNIAEKNPTKLSAWLF